MATEPDNMEQGNAPGAIRSTDVLGEPLFVSENGVKWWVDKNLTQYAAQKLGKARVWIVEEKNGRMTRLLEREGQIVADAGGLEQMACFIDITAIA
jgi:hypothetical protein